ncbi:sensor histidine kinase [Nocardiopsis algeriensis]|uniref:histidine kinase n=1 Tax=Nocardiopsis algeriensis TaxID=1478215 RepID=A0A841IRK2_9ACTN|nr:nitrate- and nitrite sensing domain-containing protein [Nocardiopsis algeriensis]MBB6119896.1 signal transduction histidine kinase [Nocardiopsis algeriensis]
MAHDKRRSLRARMITLVLVPSTLLLLVCALLAAHLTGQIRELRTTAALTEHIGLATADTISALQRERRATMESANGSPTTADTLRQARHDTDTAVHDLDNALDRFTPDELPASARQFRQLLQGLDNHRTHTDARAPAQRSPAATAQAYTDTIHLGLQVWDSLTARAHSDQVPHMRALTALMRTRELLNRQDTVLAHAVATDTFTPTAHAQFVAAAGAQAYTWEQIGTGLKARDAQTYLELDSYSALQRVYLMQDTIVAHPPQNTTAFPVNTSAWQGAAEAVDQRMRGLEHTQARHAADTANRQATDLTRSTLLVSIPALAAALASIALTAQATRRLARRMNRLRTATLEHAHQRLPDVTARLHAGHDIDADTEVPPVHTEHNDEIGDVARAFNTAQHAAVTAAVEQARLRAGVRAVFRNIARRTQSLVHRQLALLDRLERDETDPKILESLFRIDHFSTQMRRNAENLMLLSGDTPTRRHHTPVRLHEAVRAAASEIEDYTRVRPQHLPAAAVHGRVASDVVRLLAELLENATAFSPPGTEVLVSGEHTPGAGCRITVTDRGLGMGPDQLEQANALLADPPRFDLASMRENSPLGLFVVATIAGHHGLRVRLQAAEPEGVHAHLHLPEHTLTDEQARPAHTTDPRKRPTPTAPPPGPGPAPVSDPPPTPDPTGDTYKGLPVRRRRTPAPPPPTAPPPTGERPLTEIRSMMNALQAGSLRGRSHHDDDQPHRKANNDVDTG